MEKLRSKITPANGVKGVLLDDGDGGILFRVYEKDGTFIDYELVHSDLQVTITDTDAYFYKSAAGIDYLDHSPATLGYEVKE